MEKGNLSYAFRRLGDWSTHKEAFKGAWEGLKDINENAFGRATSIEHNAPALLIGSLSGKPLQSAGMNVGASFLAMGVLSAVFYPIMAGALRTATFVDDVREGPPQAKIAQPSHRY